MCFIIIRKEEWSSDIFQQVFLASISKETELTRR